MHYRIPLLVAMACLSGTALLADLQYDQTTKITGGFAASMGGLAGKATEPQTSTILVKGNRMATVSPRSASIVDLDNETITNVDYDKKTYSVMTFQQVREQIENAMKELNKGSAPDLRFDVNVRETGQTKDVNGLPAKEFILTLTMTGSDKKSGQSGSMHITNDLWVATGMRGFDEYRKFTERMAQKMGSVFQGMNVGAMGQPQMGKGMEEMAKQMAKMDGLPVLQVMRMGSTADNKPLPAASEAPELSKQSQVQMPSAGEAAGSQLERLAGIAGGLGGFGRRKPKQEQPKQEQQPQQDQAKGQQGAVLMMEVTTEMANFSSGAVDASKLEAPAGFKQVQPDLGRRR